MSAERLSPKQRIKNKILEKRLSIGEKIIKPWTALGADIFIDLVERNIVKPIKPEYPKGFDNTFMEIIKDTSVLPILISNHTGHVDVAGTAVVSRQLTDLANKVRPPENQFRGFMLTIAASLESAHQNIFLQQCTRKAIQLFPKYSLSTEAYARKKDQEKYQMNSRSNAVYGEKINEIARKANEREADGLAFYIEASVEGGRRIKEGKTKGQTKGMQRIDFEPYYPLFEKIQLRYNRKAAIIIVSGDGGFEVLDPDKGNRPTLKAIKAVTSLKEPQKSLLSIKVSMPMFYDDLIEQTEQLTKDQATPQDIGDEIGRKIAKGLPPERQGYYKNVIK